MNVYLGSIQNHLEAKAGCSENPLYPARRACIHQGALTLPLYCILASAQYSILLI